MLVADVIKDALIMLGREEDAEKFASGDYGEDGELSRTLAELLHCFNAVEDELSRGFFPLCREETLVCSGGRIYFTDFSRTPVKVVSVKRNGRAARYVIEPEYITAADGSYTVKYEYCPARKQLDGESDYPGYPVGERLLACGVAAEYCLIEGAVEESESWESRYRGEIERLRPYAKGVIPARGWI